MTNWLVTLVKTVQPFDKKKVVVRAETVIEALDEFNHKEENYTAVSASFHSSYMDVNIYGVEPSCETLGQVFSEI